MEGEGVSRIEPDMCGQMSENDVNESTKKGRTSFVPIQ